MTDPSNIQNNKPVNESHDGIPENGHQFMVSNYAAFNDLSQVNMFFGHPYPTSGFGIDEYTGAEITPMTAHHQTQGNLTKHDVERDEVLFKLFPPIYNGQLGRNSAKLMTTQPILLNNDLQTNKQLANTSKCFLRSTPLQSYESMDSKHTIVNQNNFYDKNINNVHCANPSGSWSHFSLPTTTNPIQSHWINFESDEIFYKASNERHKLSYDVLLTQTPYDENGRIRSTGQDICDCFNPNCTGCWWPCFECFTTHGSRKCGLSCRCNRQVIPDQLSMNRELNIWMDNCNNTNAK